jgi:hypothetical protein
MARWITQILHLHQELEIELTSDTVRIGVPDHLDGRGGTGVFKPSTRDEANQMSIALKMAAKRLEDIGKGLS